MMGVDRTAKSTWGSWPEYARTSLENAPGSELQAELNRRRSREFERAAEMLARENGINQTKGQI